MSTSKGRDLFIVDNGISNWTGLRYLEEWADIAKAFDIATGYFEIGSLLALDGKWQELKKIRILMGSETTHRTRKILLKEVRRKAEEKLNDSIENDKIQNPFLHGVEAILNALKSNQIECRIYDLDKFHAKAYITHAKLEVIGSQALVGSSNFTLPGLTKNIELNIQIQSDSEVAQLQEWYENYWDEASEITDAIINVISPHTHQYSPFDIYAKALQEFFKSHELTATEWDENSSKMFHFLDRYQQEAYWSLMKIAHQHGGAFLCDGVGLGKTFVGLMLIERLILHEGKRVVLFAPKGAKDGVWSPHLKKWLPHIGGIDGNADFSNLAVFSHTDLSRKGDFPERFLRITELADVVIIDEAHHFRNQGRRGNLEEEIEPSRYYKLYDLLDNTSRQKTLFMLTATPVNNRLSDFRHMAELFTRQDETYFARTLGVNNLRAHFNKMERELRNSIGIDPADVSEHMSEVQDILDADKIVQQLVVQRSRNYVRESQFRETGKSTMFPDRSPPKVAGYSIRKTYGHLLDMFDKAFRRENPLFTLPMYYPLKWYKGSDENIDPMEEGRQSQIIGLIRTNFLKRFESSIAAFEVSCNRLQKKLLAFIEVHSESDSEKEQFKLWKDQNAEILGYSAQRQLDLWDDNNEEDEEDVVPQELLDAVELLDRQDYDIPTMINEAYRDLDQINHFLEEVQKFEPNHDDKLKKLKRLLKSKEFINQKVLIFSEFAHTARYLKKQLVDDGIDVTQIDSGIDCNRADVIQRFSPYYNDTSSPELISEGRKEIRVLIATDILSEGLNLQDATKMINYDIHWNPVRLMQRIGRVDRRMSPETEMQLVSDHPEVASSRGKVSFWNFLPPDELNDILTLYTRVTQKTLLISKTLGIEGKQLLTPKDDYDSLKDFNSAYEGTRTLVEEMHLEYQSLIKDNPELEERLRCMPGAIFSGRKRLTKGLYGVFFCYALPALDKEEEKFTYEAGTTNWYFYNLERDTILDAPGEIITSIRSKPSTPRKCVTEEETLLDLRTKIEKHIKNSYLRRIDAPVGVKPKLKCWMELNEE
jgi:superfamily II DNA or RNA helicase